ncbi:YqgE/AlgH family protein [Lolliginicoccus levis]|uniref:YqgE/AlgH family protein n=1 Tax=Lolliginicoccus levis TaxID=2919542 RepID=UPI00241C986B|nr:YqgE/AlgH family protein [Lolliginicoccus levis]
MSTWDEHEEEHTRSGRAPFPGALLIASTELNEPTFRRSVVYLIDHDDSGTLGVVLNRPSETAVHDVFPQWAPLAARPQALFIGGPVSRESAVCLGTVRPGLSADGVEGLKQIEGRTVMVDLDADPEYLAPLLAGIRVFVGYAGWSSGQLGSELARDDWMMFPSLPADVLSPARIDLWGQVLRRQSDRYSMLSTHPIDVDRN